MLGLNRPYRLTVKDQLEIESRYSADVGPRPNPTRHRPGQWRLRNTSTPQNVLRYLRSDCETTRHNGDAWHKYMMAGHRIKTQPWAALPFGCTPRFQGWCENITQEQQNKERTITWSKNNSKTSNQDTKVSRNTVDTMAMNLVLK